MWVGFAVDGRAPLTSRSLALAFISPDAPSEGTLGAKVRHIRGHR